MLFYSIADYKIIKGGIYMKGKKNVKSAKKTASAKQIPWGVFAGIFAMLWSFLLIAVVAVFVVSGMMYAEVGGDDGLREAAWLTPLFNGEMITGVGCAVCLLLYRFRENRKG